MAAAAAPALCPVEVVRAPERRQSWAETRPVTLNLFLMCSTPHLKQIKSYIGSRFCLCVHHRPLDGGRHFFSLSVDSLLSGGRAKKRTYDLWRLPGPVMTPLQTQSDHFVDIDLG